MGNTFRVGLLRDVPRAIANTIITLLNKECSDLGPFMLNIQETPIEGYAEQVEALRHLVSELEDFIDSGTASYKADGSLLVESVNPNGGIHEAVCKIQPFYVGDKLPCTILESWHQLLVVCRHEKDLDEQQRLAIKHACELQKWANEELDELILACLWVSEANWSQRKFRELKAFVNGICSYWELLHPRNR
jgi:hypothetical protein